jgi:hypothetical protein
MSRELDVSTYVSGGGSSSSQMTTQGIPSETKLKTLSNSYALHKLKTKTSMFVLWLKCRNVEGVTGEKHELRSTGQGGQVLKKYRERHPFREKIKTCAFEYDNVCLIQPSSKQSMACPKSPATGHSWPIFTPIRVFKPTEQGDQKCNHSFNYMF